MEVFLITNSLFSSSSTTLQLRLQDGSSAIVKFLNSDRLFLVREHIETVTSILYLTRSRLNHSFAELQSEKSRGGIGGWFPAQSFQQR
jgi:hypothetical protein